VSEPRKDVGKIFGGTCAYFSDSGENADNRAGSVLTANQPGIVVQHLPRDTLEIGEGVLVVTQGAAIPLDYGGQYPARPGRLDAL
jgi:hypothetical protein